MELVAQTKSGERVRLISYDMEKRFTSEQKQILRHRFEDERFEREE